MTNKEVLKNCIFCNNSLDNSDEHIIPDCLNGRLHSKYLICQKCNSDKFGKQLEPAIKKLFNTILIILGFENAKSVYSEDPDGKIFLFSKGGNISQVKPEILVNKRGGKTYLSINGDSKNALKYFEKQANELLKKGHRPLHSCVLKTDSTSLPIKVEEKFQISPEIILELNKIAIEFYAYSGLDISKIKELSDRVNKMDRTLKNVVFCNASNEIRTCQSDEVSHIIVIRTHTNGSLYCYIELFNIVCAYINFYDGHESKTMYSYYQDALTGERLTEDIVLDFDKEPDNVENLNFNSQINALSDRLRSREYNSMLASIAKDLTEFIDKEVLEERIKKEDRDKILCDSIIGEAARLSVYEFPYMIEDYEDEKNDELNHIHSNLQENQYEDFCNKYNKLIGRRIDIPDEGIYLIDSFLKQPFLQRNGISLVKVFCVLTHEDFKHKRYIPYRDLFVAISIRHDT